MSDYTPTTKEVRDYYVRDPEMLAPEIDAEFNRWLTQHDAEITAQAEQRIIKLLEETYSIALEKNEFDLLDFLIALIKGENNVSHTHEIEVSGAPCIYGTFHEYCNTCDWVEPCEPEGENK